MRGDPDDLLGAIRAARLALPCAHRRLLDEIGVQEGLVRNWPDDVIAMYATLREPAPSPVDLDGAAAAWLRERRTVVFNAAALEQAVDGLNPTSRRSLLSGIAWHEYGHALSIVLAGPEQRERGVRLLKLLPAPLQEAIDHPGRYRQSQVFDEVLATVYALLIAGVPTNGYARPEFLAPELYAAFREVFPWPPIQ